MKICSVPTASPIRSTRAGMVSSRRRCFGLRSSAPHRAGFTLIELVVVISILGLFVMLVQVNLFGVLRRSQFEAEVQDFVSTMQMASSAAAENGRRYEVIVYIADQEYLLREISSSNLAEVLDEEIITQGHFGDNCEVVYVEFDDGTYTNETAAKFRIGGGGWHYGGKIVFLDNTEQAHAVIVNRLSPIVELVEGDPSLLTPKAKDEAPAL